MPGGIEVPLELAAAWQTNAFPHGTHSPPTLTLVSIIFGILALVVVSARLYDRCVVRRNAGVDDILVAVSMVRTERKNSRHSAHTDARSRLLGCAF